MSTKHSIGDDVKGKSEKEPMENLTVNKSGSIGSKESISKAVKTMVMNLIINTRCQKKNE